MTANLATIREDLYRAWVAGYREGIAYGVARALADAEADEDRIWAECSRTVRKQASSPRLSQLSDRRGEHERAAVARAHERRMGLELAG